MAENPIVIDSDSRHSSPLSDASTILSPPPASTRVLPVISNGQTKPKAKVKPEDPTASSSTIKPAVKKERKIKPKPTANGEASSSKPSASGTAGAPKVKKDKQDKDKDKKPVKKELKKLPSIPKPVEPAPLIPPHFKRPEELEVYDDKQPIVDQWQVPYIWAFLDRFNYSVAGLYSIEDLETALQAPDANEGLVNIFWDFIQDLLPQVDLSAKTKSTKGGSKPKEESAVKGKGKAVEKEYGRPKDLVPEQDRHLTVSERVRELITRRLDDEASTIWDPYTFQMHITGEHNLNARVIPLPFQVEEEEKKLNTDARTPEQLAMLEGMQGSYYLDDAAGGALKRIKEAPTGRNPMNGQEGATLQLWELKWQQRVKILRQMIDWILVENPRVKEYINELYPKTRKRPVSCAISVLPIVDKDSKMKRIWSIDDSYRVYSSGSPYKSDSPMTMIANDRASFEKVIESYTSRTREIPQLTAIWSQSSNKKRNAAAAQLERVKLDVSIGKLLEKKIEAIEIKLAAIPEERAKHQEERAKRLRTIQQRQSRAADAESRLLLAQFAPGRETRSRTKAVDYREVADIDDEDEEEDQPTVSYGYGNRKRRGSPSPEEQYNETGSESSSKRQRGMRAGLRSAGATDDDDDAMSPGNDRAESIEDDDGSEHDADSQDEDEDSGASGNSDDGAQDSAKPSLPLPKIRIKRVVESDNEESEQEPAGAHVVMADDAEKSDHGVGSEAGEDDMVIDVD